MLIIISPSKSMDFKNPTHSATDHLSIPFFSDEANQIVKTIKKYDHKELMKLLNVSEKIAKSVELFYKNWIIRASNKENTEIENIQQGKFKSCIFAYKGDVYRGIDVDTFNEKELIILNDRLRIISGLYGILKPLDVIQPYRLDMGKKLSIQKHKNLYEYWGDKISIYLKNEISNFYKTNSRKLNSKILVNLGSKEYYSAAKLNNLSCKVITPIFKDESENSKKNSSLENSYNNYKVISFLAKVARGLMTRFIVKNNIQKFEDLLTFDSQGYLFNKELTVTESEPVFTRSYDSRMSFSK